MRKNLIIALAAAGLLATTACGSKDSYRANPHGGVSKKTIIEPPLVDATVEQQAIKILEKDQTFQNSRSSEQTATLSESLDSVEMKLVHVGQADSDAQAEVTMLTSNQMDTCVPAVQKSNEFDAKDLMKGFAIKNVGRGICVDKDCNNVILIIEKKGDAFAEQESTVFGAVAVLMTRDEERVLKPVSTESDLFVQVQSIEDGINACLKAKDSGDPSAADRIIEINKEIVKLQSQIAQIQASTEMGVNEKQAFIKGLNDKIAALEAEKKSLGGETTDKPDNVGVDTDGGSTTTDKIDVSTHDGKIARIKQIDARIKDIDTEIALHQQGKILGNLNASAARIAELEKEKKNLQSEKDGLVLYL
jgi:hypothetical protein